MSTPTVSTDRHMERLAAHWNASGVLLAELQEAIANLQELVSTTEEQNADEEFEFAVMLQANGEYRTRYYRYNAVQDDDGLLRVQCRPLRGEDSDDGLRNGGPGHPMELAAIDGEVA